MGNMEKILAYCHSHWKQFMKYAIVGASGFVLDMGLLIFFKEYFGITALLAVILTQAIVLVYNFSLNKWWSFKNKEIPHKQLVRYATLAAANYGFSVLTMYIFHDRFFGFDYRLVRLASVAVMVSWNFFLYNHWVYRPEKSPNVHNLG